MHAIEQGKITEEEGKGKEWLEEFIKESQEIQEVKPATTYKVVFWYNQPQ